MEESSKSPLDNLFHKKYLLFWNFITFAPIKESLKNDKCLLLNFHIQAPFPEYQKPG